MTDETMDGSPSDQPNEDAVARALDENLRYTIASAFAEERKSQGPIAKGPVSAAEPTSIEPRRNAEGRSTSTEEQARASTIDKPVPAGPMATGPTADLVTASGAIAPPPGWSIAAKAAFVQLPDAVKEAVAKREADVSAGFARYEGLSRYVDMAQQSGQTLPAVLDRYIAAENLLTQDFGNGILSLCEFYQVNPAQLGQFLLGSGSDGQPTGQSDQFAPVLNQLNSVSQRLAQWEKQQEETLHASVRDELTRFAADPKHKFFENVRQTMGQLIAANPQTSLNDAYEQACWMNAEIRPLLLKEQQEQEAAKARAQADSARRASASLKNGSPIPGATPGSGPAPTLRAELERAFEQARI
jgi:hypothetical protein